MANESFKKYYLDGNNLTTPGQALNSACLSVTGRLSPLTHRVWAPVFSKADAQIHLMGFSNRPIVGPHISLLGATLREHFALILTRINILDKHLINTN